MLPDKERAELMLIAGCLHDISEKTVDFNANSQINDVLRKMYLLLNVDVPDWELPKYTTNETINPKIHY